MNHRTESQIYSCTESELPPILPVAFPKHPESRTKAPRSTMESQRKTKYGLHDFALGPPAQCMVAASLPLDGSVLLGWRCR